MTGDVSSPDFVGWGALGDHAFGFRSEYGRGPASETLKMGVALAEHARLGRRPTQQLAAHRLQEMELSVSLSLSDYGDPGAALEALKDSMEEGEVLDLVMGSQPGAGAWAGQWVLADIDVEAITRAPGGMLYSADVKLRLKEWVQREGLEVSKRKPPPAVKPKAAAKPAEPTGPGYRTEPPK